MPQLTWLVTGCSSGIGEHFVEAILARGDRVIATARNASERLQSATDAGAAVLDLDITAPSAELDAKAKEAIGIYGTLDVLVNNASYIEASLVEEARYVAGAEFYYLHDFFIDEVDDLVSYDRLLAQFDTNLFGTLAITQAILPYFRQKKAGVVAFIGSKGGWVAAPGGGPYSGSKFALEGQDHPFNLSQQAMGAKTVLSQGWSNPFSSRHPTSASKASFLSQAVTAPR